MGALHRAACRPGISVAFTGVMAVTRAATHRGPGPIYGRIIPVVLADAIMAVNPEKVGQWPMSTGVGSIGDFEYAERVK